jgi:hypothetical protein
MALMWELIFSGEMLNSGEAASLLPRRARVLIYLGYLLLTASAALQLATLHSPSTGGRVETVDAETIVQAGIIELGVPLAITVFLISWIRRDVAAVTATNTDVTAPSTSHPVVLAPSGTARIG